MLLIHALSAYYIEIRLFPSRINILQYDPIHWRLLRQHSDANYVSDDTLTEKSRYVFISYDNVTFVRSRGDNRWREKFHYEIAFLVLRDASAVSHYHILFRWKRFSELLLFHYVRILPRGKPFPLLRPALINRPALSEGFDFQMQYCLDATI